MAYYSQQQPFYNPKVPFTGSIQGGLRDGKNITVTGRVLPGANRFHVNLQCGSRPDATIALHFNPRYDSVQGYIVTNTKRNNSWEIEERIHRALFPQGSPFNLLILVTSQSYKISVNGIHIMDYKHRVPFNMVDTIVVDGMVEVSSINFQEPVGIIPVQAAFQPQFAFPPGYAVPAFPAPQNYSVPYKTIINGGLHSGRNISIQGVVNPHASRFTINLRHRSGIALHYNPRFDENLVVRNTLTMERWGPEERSGGMPFYKGQNFQVPTCAAQASYCMPYKTVINGGLQPGKNISIQGVINSHACRFEINLRHRSGIAFHYNPRFDENFVVRNTFAMERWGPEERCGGMPFHKGQNFQIIISCNPYHYNVFVNGSQVHTYNHRFNNLREIDILEVTGDVCLNTVHV